MVQFTVLPGRTCSKNVCLLPLKSDTPSLTFIFRSYPERLRDRFAHLRSFGVFPPVNFRTQATRR
jgi:hypothetical protein